MDRNFHRKSRPQLAYLLTLIENNFDGYTLNNFGVVAGSIVRRQEGELRSACRGDFLDMAMENTAGKSIDAYIGGITSPNVFELRLSVVRLNPNAALYERHYLNACSEQLAGMNAKLADGTIRGRKYLGVTEIDFS